MSLKLSDKCKVDIQYLVIAMNNIIYYIAFGAKATTIRNKSNFE